MAHDEELEKVRAALLDFVHTIGNTGGVFLSKEDDHYYPVGDPEWGDLGEAYIRGCEALKIKPLIATDVYEE